MSFDTSNSLPSKKPTLRSLPEGVNTLLISPSDFSLDDSIELKTYLSLFHYNLQNVAKHVGSKFESADSFELLNNGFPPFFFTVFLLAILTDDFLNEVSFDHFYYHENQDDFELSINVDAYERSLNTIFSYLEGTLSSSEIDFRVEFLKDSDKTAFLEDCIHNFGMTLERKILDVSTTDYSFINWVSRHRLQVLNTSLSTYHPKDLGCDSVYALRLPVLNYNHVLNCETGFKRTFSPEFIYNHRDFTSVNLGVKIAYSLALNFGNLYGGFASSCLDQLKITQVFDAFVDNLFKTFMGSILDGIASTNPRFSHIIPELERIRNAEARKEQLRQRELRREEKRRRKEEQRLKQAEARKQQIAKRESQRAKRESERAMIEAEEKRIKMIELAEYAAKKAIEEEALKIESDLIKVNYILERKSIIISLSRSAIEQLNVALLDTSGKSDAWQAELRDSLINLKAEFESLENFAEVDVPSDYVSKDTFDFEEFDEYNAAIKEDFNLLFSKN